MPNLATDGVKLLKNCLVGQTMRLKIIGSTILYIRHVMLCVRYSTMRRNVRRLNREVNRSTNGKLSSTKYCANGHARSSKGVYGSAVF